MTWYNGRYIQSDEIKFGNELGKGGFATVYEGSVTVCKDTVAIKKLDIPNKINAQKKSKIFREFRHEVFIQLRLKHKNIVDLIGICLSPLCVVMEYLPGGTVHSLIHDSDTYISWRARIKIAIGLANGIRFMHEQVPPIVHCDIKSPNILLATRSVAEIESGDVKISDFGTSKLLINPITGRFVDNPVWLAPEIMKNEPYNEKVDTYAYGVIIWELLTREEFFGEWSFFSDIQDLVVSGKRPGIPEGTPLIYENVIQKCWDPNPAERPKFDWVLGELKKLNDISDLIEKALGPKDWAILQTKQEQVRIKQKEEEIAQQSRQEQVLKRLVEEADQARIDKAQEKLKPSPLTKKYKSKKSDIPLLYEEMYDTPTAFKAFHNWLMLNDMAGEDLSFGKEAREFRMNRNAPERRKTALSIASTFLGLSNKSECELKFITDKESLQHVLEAIVANNISNDIFNKILDELEPILRSKYHSFCEYYTRMLSKTNSSEDLKNVISNVGTVTLTNSSTTLPEYSKEKRMFSQMLNDASLTSEFEKFINGTPYFSLFHCYKSLDQFANAPDNNEVFTSTHHHHRHHLHLHLY
eukprot:TRINITY_DN4547_c0_g1_i2.p1 TRINITY_DN4547_c0_g1~~TRINITY_DN4547_c0_g1_i2.p1  ORF type:complete len:582 (+),score=141.35 TRINITY_DN4547_c0_g1_i2:124-1869(+)